jgi:hypothetical protein
VCGLREDNPDQRGKREGDQKFLRLQTEAQTIHGGRKRESTVITGRGMGCLDKSEL